MAKIDKLKEKYGVKHYASVGFMNRMDPTKSRKYLGWLFKMRYIKDGDTYLPNTDFPTRFGDNVGDYLTWRERNLQKMDVNYRDINVFKNIKDFMSYMKPIAVLSREDVKKDVRVIFEDENWKVISPTSISASKVYGRGTKWCTTSNVRYFKSYKNQGELYYIMDKTSKIKYGLPICAEWRYTPLTNLGDETFYDNIDDGISFGCVKDIHSFGIPWEKSIVIDFNNRK